jgi:hypothetical protein
MCAGCAGLPFIRSRTWTATWSCTGRTCEGIVAAVRAEFIVGAVSAPCQGFVVRTPSCACNIVKAGTATLAGGLRGGPHQSPGEG